MKITVKQVKPRPPPKKFLIELSEEEAKALFDLCDSPKEHFSTSFPNETIDWTIYRELKDHFVKAEED